MVRRNLLERVMYGNTVYNLFPLPRGHPSDDLRSIIQRILGYYSSFAACDSLHDYRRMLVY